MKKFQAGGGVTAEMIESTPGVWVGGDPEIPTLGALAAVASPEEEEEETEELSLAPMEVSASDPGISGLREMATLNRAGALARLRAGQERISGRRAERQKEDERARWLALAQGMLAPTRTGGFGESLGQSAGLLRQEAERRRRGEEEMIEMEMNLADQERGIESDYIKSMAGLMGGEAALRPTTVGTENLVPHPDDPTQFAYVQQWRDPATGESKFEYVTIEDPNTGEQIIPRAIDKLDAQIQAGVTAAREAAEGRMDRSNADIEMGRAAYAKIGQFETGLELLDQLEAQGGSTGGVQALMLKFANLFGVNDPTVTTMGAVNRYLGEQVLEGLQHFQGQLSNMELGYMIDLESGIKKGTDINRALLQRGISILRGQHRRGIAAATSRTDYGGFLGSPSDFAALGIDDINAYLGGTGYDSQFGETPTQGAIGAGGLEIGRPGSTADNPIPLTSGMDRPPSGAYVINEATGEVSTVN